jgi:hypothetical protein
LTFNTTSLPLFRAIKDKRILLREPLRPRLPVVEERHLLVTPEIDAMLDGFLHKGLFPAVPAEILIGIFSAGQLLVATRRMPRKKEAPDLEQIVNGQDEVWALCIRRPRPGWRLLGRWYERNQFVALRAWDKHRLAGHYAQAVEQVTKDWEAEFGTQQPHRGNELRNYVGGVINELA